MKNYFFLAILLGASCQFASYARAAVINVSPTHVLQPALPKAPPPAKRLLLANIDRQSAADKFLVLALQGLVNRTQPRLYVYDRQYEGGNDIKLHQNIKDWWQGDLQRRGYRFEAMNEPRRLVKRFRKAFRGAILYEKECWTNPDLANNINAITMLCGLNNLVPVTPEMNKTLHLPVMHDVRGRWHSADEVDSWAQTDKQLKANCNRRVSAVRHPWSLYLTDYIIANKMFVFWVGKKTFADEVAKERYTRFLAMTEPNTAVMGAWQSWWPKSPANSELEGVEELTLLKRISDSGRFLIPVVSVGNFTVHSGFRIRPLKQKPRVFRRLENDKVYVTFVLSDGDNISGFMLIRPLLWQDPMRGRIPIGWNFTPAMFDLCPNVLEYFYRTATPNDYFVTASAGIGYTMDGYASALAPDKIAPTRNDYMAITQRYMKATDSREMWNWWVGSDSIQGFVAGLPELNAMFIEPEARTDAYEESFHTFRAAPQTSGVPIFHNFGSAGFGLAPQEAADEWIRKITARVGSEKRPRFVFIGPNGFQTTPSRISEFVARLPRDYVVVRPDEFVHLYKVAQNNAPASVRK